MENVLAGTRMEKAVRRVLAEYFTNELTDRIVNEIAEKYLKESTDPSFDELVDLRQSASHQ